MADETGEWKSNAMRFATQVEAVAYANDLYARWILVREARAVECDDPVTHVWIELLNQAVNLDDPSLKED